MPHLRPPDRRVRADAPRRRLGPRPQQLRAVPRPPPGARRAAVARGPQPEGARRPGTTPGGRQALTATLHRTSCRPRLRPGASSRPGSGTVDPSPVPSPDETASSRHRRRLASRRSGSSTPAATASSSHTWSRPSPRYGRSRSTAQTTSERRRLLSRRWRRRGWRRRWRRRWRRWSGCPWWWHRQGRSIDATGAALRASPRLGGARRLVSHEPDLEPLPLARRAGGVLRLLRRPLDLVLGWAVGELGGHEPAVGALRAREGDVGHARDPATGLPPAHSPQPPAWPARLELVEASEEVLPLGGGDVEGLVELGELLAARRGSAGLPLRDGLLGDADLPGEVGLGEAAPSADTFDERGHGEGVLGHRRSR